MLALHDSIAIRNSSDIAIDSSVYKRYVKGCSLLMLENVMLFIIL